MKFLITHYEGLKSELLKVLVETIDKEFGYCYLVIPQNDQLRSAHMVSDKYISYEEIPPLYNSEQTIIVDGTTSDCIRIGKELFKDKIDIIISGITPQASLGYDNIYNANTQAAMEGAILGYPSIAIHTGAYNIVNLAAHITKIMNLVITNELYKKYPLLNINIPQDPQGFSVAKMGGSITYPIFSEEENVFQLKYSLTQPAEDLAYDGGAYHNNKIVFTPIRLRDDNLNDIEALKKEISKLK